MRPKNSKRVTLRINPHTHGRLEDLAARMGASVNYIIRRAIIEHLDRVAPEKQ